MTEALYKIVLRDREGNEEVAVPCLRSIEAVGYTSQINGLSFATGRVAIAELLPSFGSNANGQIQRPLRI